MAFQMAASTSFVRSFVCLFACLSVCLFVVVDADVVVIFVISFSRQTPISATPQHRRSVWRAACVRGARGLTGQD